MSWYNWYEVNKPTNQKDSKMKVMFSSPQKKHKNVLSYRILLPLNRKGYRFLKAINKIRVFLDEEPLRCIPGAENIDDFMQILFGTRCLKSRRFKIDIRDVFNNTKKHNENRISLELNLNENKKEVLCDYLRTRMTLNVTTVKSPTTGKVRTVKTTEVILPKAISNFIFNHDFTKYHNNPKLKSLEQQIKEGHHYKNLDV
jgi:hypothetical protein